MLKLDSALFSLWLQNTASNRGGSFFQVLRDLGAFGLFFLAILDSSPLPTFGGPDILLVILVSAHRNPWYMAAVIAAVGSIVGAYITFRLARTAGEAYLNGKFGENKVSAFLKFFKKRGTGTLVASTAIPLPFPTSLVFAAAGASDYHLGKFLAVVTLCRCLRYVTLALVADRYGRRFLGVLRHPTQHFGWFLLFVAATACLIGAGLLLNRRISNAA